MPLRHIIILLLLSPVSLQAQDVLTGKVYKTETDVTLAGVTVTNLNSKKAVATAIDGSYRITAEVGDKVSFYYIGFKADTVLVVGAILRNGYDVYLMNQIVMMENVNVSADYKADSLERAEYNRHIYLRETRITGGHTPQAGVGIVLSPFSYFSREKKDIRKMKKRLKQQEKDYYIDAKFPAAWVSRVTGLKGDSLSLFMYQFRPDYKFARKTDQPGMLLYVNEKYKEFTNPKKRKER